MLWGLDYVRGYLELRLCGHEPERCLNAFLAQNIGFWKLERPDDMTLTCRILGE